MDNADETLKLGEVVTVPYGLAAIHGTVVELYCITPRAHVVVEPTPTISGHVVDQPTTVSLPLDSVRRAAGV